MDMHGELQLLLLQVEIIKARLVEIMGKLEVLFFFLDYFFYCVIFTNYLFYCVIFFANYLFVCF